MNKLFLALLICTPLALLAALAHLSPLIVFTLSAIALIPLAKYIGDATDELASHTNPGLGGLLNATFGNAPELIVGIFALRAGLLEVVKAAIIGSVLGNVLLVLGTAILAGGWKRESQKFNATAAKAGGSMLLLASIALIVPALFTQTSASSAHVLLTLSVIVSVLMIFSYAAQLLFMLRTHKHLYASMTPAAEARWSVSKSIGVLAAATIATALVSDLLVSAITPLVTSFGVTQLFLGVIIIAIVGNAAEHATAIQAAVKNRMELAISITIGSATQVVMFVAPVLVLLSFLLGHPMSLVFNFFELITFIFAVLVTNAVIEDGETNWLEGMQLLVAYGILVLAFYLYR